MIPWVREKFAERRARWVASRKRNENSSSSSPASASSSPIVAATSSLPLSSSNNTVRNTATSVISTESIIATNSSLINGENINNSTIGTSNSNSRRILFERKHNGKNGDHNSSGKLLTAKL